MAFYHTYIAQLKNDDTTTSGVSATDILQTYGIAVEEVPFVTLPETKDITTRDWKDEDGEDVYIPNTRRIQAYDLQIRFLYVGQDNEFRANLSNFINFLYGRNSGATGSRLAIYDEHVKMGRKDITVKQVSTELFFRQDNTVDTDPVIAEFTVTFRVHNPVTEVNLTKTKATGSNNTFATKTGLTLDIYNAKLTW